MLPDLDVFKRPRIVVPISDEAKRHLELAGSGTEPAADEERNICQLSTAGKPDPTRVCRGRFDPRLFGYASGNA